MNLPDRYQRMPFEPGHDAALVPFRSAERPGPIEMLGISSILRRRMLMVSCIVGICTLLAIALTLVTPRQYASHSDIAIEAVPEAQLPGRDEERRPAEVRPMSERVDTEIQVLSSRQLAERLLIDADLAHDPVFREAVLQPGGPLTNLLQRLGLRQPEEYPAGIEETNAFRQGALDYLANALQAYQLGQSSAIRISFTTVDPALSQKLADGLARAYIADRVAAKVEQNKQAIATLQGRIEELRVQAQNDFGAVQRYRIRNNLLSSAATALTEGEISTYNQQVAAARAEASQDQARLRAARSQLAGGSGDVGAGTGSAVISALRSQRAALSANVADMAQRYRPDHPDLVGARRQLADIDRQIDSEVGRTIRDLEARASTSASRLQSLTQSQSSARGALAENNNSLIELDGLQRRAEASQGLYESYLNRYKETVARSGTETSGVRILSNARLQRAPVQPKPLLNVAFGLLVGLVLGALAAVASEMSFRGFTTPDDVERKLGRMYVGSLPLLKAIGSSARTCAEAVRLHPGGIMAESMRSIITRLSHLVPNYRVLAVASAVAGEGKSTLAASLARVLGRAGVRVVVIDCDVARPQLSRQVEAEPGAPGLREVIAGEATLEEALVPDEIGNVFILPITQNFPEGERLARAGALDRVIEQCREQFDMVIMDCSPILLIAESREVVALADVTLFSVLWRSTSDSTVTAAFRLLPEQVLSRIGVVLNKVDIRKRRRFGGSDATFFYTRHRQYYAEGAR